MTCLLAALTNRYRVGRLPLPVTKKSFDLLHKFRPVKSPGYRDDHVLWLNEGIYKFFHIGVAQFGDIGRRALARKPPWGWVVCSP